jgi:hypothetical protein
MDVGDPIDGPALDAALDAGRAAVNNVDGTQIVAGAGITYKALDTGVITHPRGAANPVKAIYGNMSITAAAAAAQTFAIVWTTHGYDSPTAFSSATNVVVTISIACSDTALRLVHVRSVAPSTTGVTYIIRKEDNSAFAGTETLSIDFIAFGRTT